MGIVSDGTNVWFSEKGVSKVARIIPSSGLTVEFSLPTTLAMPGPLALDSNGVIWLTELYGTSLVAFNPWYYTQTVTPYPIQCVGPGSFAMGIAAGADRVYFTEVNRDKLGVVNTNP